MDTKLIGLLSIFFLVFGVFMTVLLFNDNLTTITKAKDELIPSNEKSIILAYPLSVKAGAGDSKVTVWVRNREGKGIPNQPVSLTTSHGSLDVSALNSDGQGRAIFSLTSATPGTAILNATIAGTITPSNTVSVVFIQ
jgi:hypothetical protein